MTKSVLLVQDINNCPACDVFLFSNDEIELPKEYDFKKGQKSIPAIKHDGGGIVLFIYSDEFGKRKNEFLIAAFIVAQQLWCHHNQINDLLDMFLEYHTYIASKVNKNNIRQNIGRILKKNDIMKYLDIIDYLFECAEI